MAVTSLPMSAYMMGNGELPQPNGMDRFKAAISSPFSRDLALALLANSRGPNAGSFGQALGVSGLQAQAMGQQRQQQAIENQIAMAKLQQIQNGQGQSPWGSIPVERVTPESRKKFEQTGKYSDLEFIPEQRQLVDTAEMRNFKFREGLSPEQQRQFDDIIRQNYGISTINGVETQVRKGPQPQTTPLNTIENEAQAAQRLAAAKGEGQATGEAAGAQAAKAPVVASFDAALSNMADSVSKAQQGGFLGVKGKAAPAMDKRNADLFNSRIQQLSTELRTIFRIPGEGSLSDSEQAQYGLQLPKLTFDAETNAQILKDLNQRVKLRSQTPIGGKTPAATDNDPLGIR